MRTKQHLLDMLDQNPAASIGFTLAADMVFAARYGSVAVTDHSSDEWKQIARTLKSQHGEQLDQAVVRAKMK